MNKYKNLNEKLQMLYDLMMEVNELMPPCRKSALTNGRTFLRS